MRDGLQNFREISPALHTMDLNFAQAANRCSQQMLLF
jgi:hypothetical protein